MTLPPFQALLDAHRAEVYRYLRGALGVPDADDAFQETFLSALRAYPKLRDANHLRAWVFTIARRKAIDVQRRRARETGAELPDMAVAPAELGVWDEVDGLPPKQRTAVRHRYLDDMPYAEIAARMRTSEEAARRNVHEGLKKLKEK